MVIVVYFHTKKTNETIMDQKFFSLTSCMFIANKLHGSEKLYIGIVQCKGSYYIWAEVNGSDKLFVA